MRLITEEAQNRGRLSRKHALVTHSVLDLADCIDGKLSRRFNAVTPWGNVIDSLADKADFAIQEGYRMRRGEIDPLTLAMRLARDAMSTYFRHQESLSAEYGAVKTARTAATWAGKTSTALRSIANRISDAYPESSTAQLSRHLATASLAASLVSNARDFYNNRPCEHTDTALKQNITE